VQLLQTVQFGLFLTNQASTTKLQLNLYDISEHKTLAPYDVSCEKFYGESSATSV
jgi:hypothetical protein